MAVLDFTTFTLTAMLKARLDYLPGRLYCLSLHALLVIELLRPLCSAQTTT